MSNVLLRGVALVYLISIAACGSSNKGGAADGGGGAGQTGSEGGAGGDVGGTGGASGAFTAVAPCAESDFTAGNAVAFPNADTSYSPKCLKVMSGDTVTFTGDFSMHPLEASRKRGNTAANPITSTGSGTSQTFTFSTAGFFAYYCSMHGTDVDGTGMAGVVWVP